MTSVNYQLTLDHVKQKSLVSTLTQIPKHASHSHTVAAKEMETISSPQKPARTDVAISASFQLSLDLVGAHSLISTLTLALEHASLSFMVVVKGMQTISKP
jgi:hypothetical protein